VSTLVDTSIWSLALRRKSHHLSSAEQVLVAELAELVKAGRARLLGVVRQELLSGIKTAEHYERLRTTLRSFPDEVVETTDHELAAKSRNECRSKGIAVSMVDALICAVSLSRDCSIFTSDPDFKTYASVLKIKLHTLRS